MVANKEKPHHIVELVECFQKCGVGSFAIWEDKDSNKQKWTSMSGNDKMKVLQRLPDMLNGILSPDTETTVIQIWKTFYDIYDVANHGKETGKDIFLRAKTWLELFLSLNGELKGYQTYNVTPYMHCLVYHVPAMVDLYGPLARLSGQGIEKLNDDIKSIHQRKTQKWDATVEALVTRKRMEENASSQREPRTYVKRKLQYWEEEIQEDRKKKRDTIAKSITDAEESDEDELDNMSIADLRDKLTKQGVNTKATVKSTLVSMLGKLDPKSTTSTT
jgi:hypothetical protein